MKQLLIQHKHVFYFFLAVTFIFYANSLKNKYALDDDYITVTNLPIKGKEKEFRPSNKLIAKGLKGIPKIWKSSYATDGESNFEYRPVTTSSFAIEYGIFGQNPFISHFINILLYGFIICLLFMVLYILYENYKFNFIIAFGTSLVFLIHPIHTEVVNNLKCRDELLAFFFGLLALWFSLKTHKYSSFKYFVFVILFLLLGILSKRSAMIFIAIIPLCLLFFRKVQLKTGAFFGMALIVLAAFKKGLKTNLLPEQSLRIYYHFENPLYVIPLSFLGNVIAGLKTFGYYLKLLVFAYPLRFYYGGNVVDVSATINVYFYIAILFLVLSVVYYFKTKNKLFLFALFLFLGSLLPFVNFYIPAPGVAAERFIFQASLGFCLLIVTVALPFISEIQNFKPIQLIQKPIVYILPVIIISLFYTWNRNSQWYNKLSLFEHDIVYTENSAKANSLLGNEYFEALTGNSPQKKYSTTELAQKAIMRYELALAADSSIYTAYNNAGVVAFSFLNDIPKARKYFLLAINHKKNYAQAYENLGNCYKREHHFTLAFNAYKKSIESNNKQYSAYNELIKMLIESRKFKQAELLSKIALTLFPDDYFMTINLANSYLLSGDKEQALPLFEEAYEISPNDELQQFIDNQKNE